MVLTCFSSPSEMPTSIRLFAPSICGDDLGFAGFQLRALEIVLGRHQVHRVLLVDHAVRRLGLDDFAVDGADGGVPFEQVLFLLRGVEFDDDLALLESACPIPRS